MFGQVSTLTFSGIEAKPVMAQVQISPGLFAFVIVGLPDKAVAESRERVRGALHALGIGLPSKHITISLAPADLPKEGSHFDLPIILALLVACGVIAQDAMDDFCAVGELALDGTIAPVIGALPAAIGANALGKGLICPKSCGAEAAWASADMDILAPDHLLALVNHFKGLQSLTRPEPRLSLPWRIASSRDSKGFRSRRSPR
jgi:magnesium chelatase family protein